MNQVLTTTPAQLFNPGSAGFRSNPYPAFHQLRQLAPVCYRPEKNDWLITRYDTVSAILKSVEFGRSEPIIDDSEQPIQQNNHQPRLLQTLLARRAENELLLKQWMVLQNPPAQTRIRKLCQQSFNSRSMQALRSFILTKCDELLAKLKNRDHFDIIHDYAYPITVETNCKLLGIQLQGQHKRFYRWTKELALMTDLDVSAINKERGLLAMSEMVDFFSNWTQSYQQSSNANNALLGLLCDAHRQGKLSQEELISNCIFLLFTGQSTTKHLIATCILSLVNNPDQLSRLKHNPDLIASAVLEALRFDSPIQVISRQALSDTQLSGYTISKHQNVHCLMGAANRDHTRFKNPDDFDITRKPEPPISFGQGIHYCLGAQMAKLVSEIAVMKLIEQFPNLSINKEQLNWEESFLVHGLSAMPAANK